MLYSCDQLHLSAGVQRNAETTLIMLARNLCKRNRSFGFLRMAIVRLSFCVMKDFYSFYVCQHSQETGPFSSRAILGGPIKLYA